MIRITNWKPDYRIECNVWARTNWQHEMLERSTWGRGMKSEHHAMTLSTHNPQHRKRSKPWVHATRLTSTQEVRKVTWNELLIGSTQNAWAMRLRARHEKRTSREHSIHAQPSALVQKRNRKWQFNRTKFFQFLIWNILLAYAESQPIPRFL